MECRHCGSFFEARRKNSVCCCEKCSQALYRARPGYRERQRMLDREYRRRKRAALRAATGEAYKAFLERERHARPIAPKSILPCDWCGALFLSRKTERICSTVCERARDHRRAVLHARLHHVTHYQPRPPRDVACLQCGKAVVVQGTGKNRLLCSPECRDARRRELERSRRILLPRSCADCGEALLSAYKRCAACGWKHMRLKKAADKKRDKARNREAWAAIEQLIPDPELRNQFSNRDAYRAVQQLLHEGEQR